MYEYWELNHSILVLAHGGVCLQLLVYHGLYGSGLEKGEPSMHDHNFSGLKTRVITTRRGP